MNKLTKNLIITVGLCLIVTATGILSREVLAGVPGVISYQGRVTDAVGDPVADGAHTFDFTIFDLPAVGAAQWSELAVVVNTTDGLFAYELGSSSPFSTTLFVNADSLFLQVTVDGEIQSPRTRLVSVPYSATAGNLRVSSSSNPDNLAIMTFPSAHRLSTFGTDGKEQIRLWGESWGEILLHDGDTTNDLTVQLKANGSSGGELELTDDNGALTIDLHGGLTGDGSVVIPDDAINADEMLNEPGIASSNSNANVALNTGGMVDLGTVTITIPADGYIVLHAKAYALMSGTLNSNQAFFQIDETVGGVVSTASATRTGNSAYFSTTTHRWPVAIHRVYFKIAGTYTFRFEAQKIGADGSASGQWPMLTAIYYPTSYGTVQTIATSSGGNPNAKAVQVTDESGEVVGEAFTMDLRYYEMKAKEARVKALEAELALRKAQDEVARREARQVIETGSE